MKAGQRALRFQCKGNALVGIVDVPERPLARGVLVLTGASHYRIGARRQLTLMTRLMAGRGIAAMRFDQRGVGDSEGEAHGLDGLDDDIRAAIGEFSRQVPEMSEIVIWGLGEAATAAVVYARADARVAGLVLLNPVVHNAVPAAHATLRHYYLPRMGELGFWKKIATGKLDFMASASALRQNLRSDTAARGASLAQRMLAGIAGFKGPVLAILSGDARATRDAVGLLERHHVRCRRVDVAPAVRGQATRRWRDDIAQISVNWITSW